jgi:hypothetical protein
MQNYRNNGMAYTNQRPTPVCVIEKPKQDDLYGMPLAMAYVPMQKWKTVYANDVALNRGTLFPELDLPFTGRGGMKHE